VARAAATCREAGATAAWALATHPVLGPGADEALADDALDRLLVGDTIPVTGVGDGVRVKVEVVGTGGLLGEAIRRLHAGGDIEALRRDPPPSAQALPTAASAASR